MWGNQRGDTLVEVVIATVIIGSILVSAYAISTKAFQLGRSAKERTQAAELLQYQAEGLTALRDNAASWDDFYDQVNATNKTAFHASGSLGTWQLLNNSGGGYWQPGCAGVPCDSGQNPTIANYYDLKVSAEYEYNPVSPSEVDKIKFTIEIKWERLGGGPEETSQMILRLTDRTLPLVSFEPGAEVGYRS